MSIEKAETEQSARRLSAAIVKLASDEAALNNLELYLSRHGDTWLKRFAATFSGLAAEFEQFASISGEEEA